MIYKDNTQLLFLLSLPVLYLGVAIYTYLGTFIWDWALNVPFNLYDDISLKSISESIYAFFWASVFYVLGWSFVHFTLPRISKPKYILINHLQQPVTLGRNAEYIIILIAIFVPVVFVLSYGFAPLIERTGYLDLSLDRNHGLSKIHAILYPIAAFGIAFLRKKYISLLLLFLNFLPLFASSKRGAGIVLVIYAIAVVIKNRGKTNLSNFLMVLLGIYIMIWMLIIRNNEIQGVLSNAYSFFSFDYNLDAFLLGLNYITSFSVYGFAYTIDYLSVDLKPFLVSLSPMPLSFHGGFSAVSAFSLNANSPIPAVPSVYMMGFGIYAIFFIFLGAISFLISFNLKSSSLLGLATISVFMLAVILSIQYNLRGFGRLVYLSGFLAVLSHISLRNFRYIRFG
jgi:hypothetical protein